MPSRRLATIEVFAAGVVVTGVLSAVACGSGDAPDPGLTSPGASSGWDGTTSSGSSSGTCCIDGTTSSSSSGGPDGGRVSGPPLPTLLRGALDAAYMCSLAKGSVQCWGNYQEKPALIDASTDWIQISIGSSPTSNDGVGCGRKTDKTIWCWTDRQPTPARLDPGAYTDFSSNGSVTCAIDVAGKLFCLGGPNNYGEVGVGDTKGHPTFTQVGTDTDWARVEIGEISACALKTSGAIHCWGANDNGRLGTTIANPVLSPAPIAAGSSFTDFAVGAGSECGVRSDGRLLCWGNSNIPGVTNDTPTPVDAATDWVEVRLGIGYLCARKTNGTVWCMGQNGRGEVGNGTLQNVLTITQVGADADWQTIAAASSTSCAAHADGTVECWGDGNGGMLGRAPIRPTLIGNAGEWQDVVTRGRVTCGLKTTGELDCWGAAGILGFTIGPDQESSTPLSMGAGTWTGAAVSPVDLFEVGAGGVSSMGDNPSGMDGVGKLGPVKTLTPTGFLGASVAAGSSHACGLIAGGSLSCWGRPNEGQLGFTSPSNVLTPTASGSATYKALAASSHSTCGIRTDGTLWCWGAAWGVTPAEVSSATTWSYLSSVRTDDAYYAVADGARYGFQAGATSPGSALDGTSWRSWTADTYYSTTLGLHGCGIRADGALLCDGWNDTGEVGDGTLTDAPAPVQIGTATDWTKVVTGDSHSCGLRAGSLYCWGGNGSGQVGDGSGWRTTPGPLLAP
jgi:alpha-tubulin suppressor-like RCC1 family protein